MISSASDGSTGRRTARGLCGDRRTAGAGAGDAGSARLARYDRERVVARATARRKSLLVLTDV